MTVQDFIKELEQEAGQNGSQKEIVFEFSWPTAWLDQDGSVKEPPELDAIRSIHPKKVTIWLS